jgi:hypothetical protein
VPDYIAPSLRDISQQAPTKKEAVASSICGKNRSIFNGRTILD